MFEKAKIGSPIALAMALAMGLGTPPRQSSARPALSERIAFEVSTDRLEYAYVLTPPLPPVIPGPTVRARIRLANESGEELRLTFASSQRFDVLLQDERGRVVFRWSDGKVFLPVLGQEIVRPGEALTYEVTFALPDSTQGLLPAGRYTLTGLLVAEAPFSGSLPVRIVHAP